MSYDSLSRRAAGVLIVVALLVSPLSAAAAPAGEVSPASWSALWQGLVDGVLGWFAADPGHQAPQPAPGVRSTSDLGSTLDPDGASTAPGEPTSSEPFGAPDPSLGSTLDPDG